MRRVPLTALGVAAAGLLVWSNTSTSEAQPRGPATFCETYADAPACTAGAVACTTCHVSPPSLNPYGLDVQAELVPGEDRPLHEDVFSAELGAALLAVEALDSDEDGFDNRAEIQAGSAPGDASSTPDPADCVDTQRKDGYDVCGYDPGYAFKKVHLDFCGMSPTMLEREQFAKASPKQQQVLLHEALDQCLDAEAWRGLYGRVWNLANAKIGPQQAVKTGRNSGPIPLADYDDDYAYWLWTQTDDRDARLVLTGQTFVSSRYEDGKTVLEEWSRRPDEDAELRGFDRYQAVVRERRAGMITHRWFLMSNTMFTGVPRTTAAQAYRAYLGFDIARLEGLESVPGEPADYDNKGVGQQGCAVCHATLDPLTYPFSRYEGIGGNNRGTQEYAYNADRLDGFTWTDGPRVADTPEQGMLFGEPVQDLLAWAEVAANSEAFRRATVRDYWRMLFHEEPRPTEITQFEQLVSDFGTVHDYRVERMLHALIDTEAYGAP